MKELLEIIGNLFNSVIKWLTIFSVVCGCGWMWSAIWLAHYGNFSQIYERKDVFWVYQLSNMEQLVLFVATPFVSAILGGIIFGIILEVTLAKLLGRSH